MLSDMKPGNHQVGAERRVAAEGTIAIDVSIASATHALLGFRRNGQWNLHLAVAVCLGGACGGLIGPFLRASLLSNADTFRFAIGIMLTFVSVHLLLHARREYLRHGRIVGTDLLKRDGAKAGLGKMVIETVSFSFRSISWR